MGKREIGNQVSGNWVIRQSGNQAIRELGNLTVKTISVKTISIQETTDRYRRPPTDTEEHSPMWEKSASTGKDRPVFEHIFIRQ
jgi:hypothetical protein